MDKVSVKSKITSITLMLALCMGLFAVMPITAFADGSSEEIQIYYTVDNADSVSAFLLTLAQEGTFSITLQNPAGKTMEFKSSNGYKIGVSSSDINESSYDAERLTFIIRAGNNTDDYQKYIDFFASTGNYKIISVPMPEGYELTFGDTFESRATTNFGVNIHLTKSNKPADISNTTKYTFSLDGDTMYMSDVMDRYIIDDDRYIITIPRGAVFSFPKEMTIDIYGGAERENKTIKAGELVTPNVLRDYAVILGGKLILVSVSTSDEAYEMNINSYQTVGAEIRTSSEFLTKDATPSPTPQPPVSTLTPEKTLNAKPASSSILVNGENVAFDAYNISGNNYFKLRDLAYALNGSEKQFELGWDGTNNAISLTSGSVYTAVGSEMAAKGTGDKIPTPTSSKIYLDGKEVSFTAYNIDGNNYFKLRDIGQAFDFDVDWDSENNTIIIDTSKGYTPE